MFNLIKTLDTKYKLLLIIILVIIVVPFIMWLVMLIHDGVVHFFGGKTKDDIIASQKTTINRLIDTKNNNEQTLNIINKKNKIDINHISKVNNKIKKASKDTIEIKSHVDDTLDKYVNDVALMLKDKSFLNIDVNQPTVKKVVVIKKHKDKKINIIKKKKVETYVIDKKKYEVEGYKNITSIWNAYETTKDLK